MNIICIGPAFPLRGGIANFNTSLCRALKRSGHESTIISFSLQYPGFLFPGKTQYENGPPPGDLTIYPLVSSLNPLSWGRSAGFIRNQEPDLIIIHHWMPFLACSMGAVIRRIKRKADITVIAITHNVIPHEKHPGWKMLTSRLIRRCDGFIVLSRSVVDDLDRFTANPHRLYAPHPIYDIFGDRIGRKDAASRLSLDPDSRYILFFGYVRKYKGLDLLLKAFARIKSSPQDLKLLVAGEFYTDRKEAENLISELGLGQRVIIRDEFIPAADVKCYFSIADLVAQPYLSATQSGVTQIAYHFGVPMLVTDVGGLAEIVPDGVTGYVTQVSETSIAEALDDFVSTDRAETFRKNILEERKRFSWEAMTTSILDLADRIKDSVD